MTNELEKKFYNWLMLNYCVPIKPEKIAHDLAEIAGSELILMETVCDSTNKIAQDKIKESRAENIKLKQQLSEIKYLSRNNVKEIMSKYTKPDMLQWTHQINKSKPVATCFYSSKDWNNCLNEICFLALPTKERIVEILEKYVYVSFEPIKQGFQMAITLIRPKETYQEALVRQLNAIATEILGDDK